MGTGLVAVPAWTGLSSLAGSWQILNLAEKHKEEIKCKASLLQCHGFSGDVCVAWSVLAGQMPQLVPTSAKGLLGLGTNGLVFQREVSGCA